MADRIHCLILLKSEVGSSSEGYTLVSAHLRQYASDALLSLLNATAPYVAQDQVNPAPNAKFDLIEVWQDLAAFTKPNKAQRWRIFVDVYNVDLVRRLFPAGANVEFVTRFRMNKKNAGHQWYPALDEENLKIIEKLLQAKADIKWRRPEGGNTLAHFATERGSVPLITLLRQYAVDLNVGGNENAMPLHAAVQKKDLETLKTLLDNGADIDGKTVDGSTALHLATKAKLSEMVRLLAEKGAHLDAKNARGWTALHMAADTGNLVLVSLLLEHGADVESRINTGTDEGATPLHAAIKRSRWTVARRLVEHGADLNAECRKGCNALGFTVITGDTDFLKYLINRGLDRNSSGNKKAFYLAFQRHYDTVMKKMIELGFSIDADDVNEPDVLFGAIHKNFFDIVKRLLEAGADVHQKHLFFNIKTTPIHVACRHANVKMVQLLLDHGADPGAFRGTGHRNTPIADAVESGKVETVKLLLAKNMIVRDRPEFLRKATKENFYELMELLLENGTPMGRKSWYERYEKLPISIAAERGNQKAADILMKYGASFDFRDISCEISASTWSWIGRVSPEFLKAFLPYGFTTDLDTDGTAHLHEIFNKCDLTPAEDEFSFRNYGWKRRECVKVVAQFVVKMEAAGMKVAVSIRSFVPASVYEVFDLDKVRRECEKEVHSMKERNAAHSGVTFFDILTGTSNRVARYMRNGSVRNELQDYDFGIEYPHYASILERQFQRGNWRRELIDKAIGKLRLLNSRFRVLPLEVREGIVSFLNNQDLLTLQKCTVQSSQSCTS